MVNEGFFDTLTVRVPGQAARIAARARESRINLRLVDADHLGISFDETTRRGRMQPAAATLLQRWHHAERNEESSRVDDTALARLPMVPCFAR